jgi:LPXTG-site transpeptidase (sortase) family protein
MAYENDSKTTAHNNNLMKKIISIFRKNFLLAEIATALFVVSFFAIHSAEAAITGQLDLGSSGSDVIALQTYLAANADFYPSGQITGIFDSSTQLAMEKFQTAQGIISSGTPETTGYGRVGPQTLIRLNSLINLIPTNLIANSSISVTKNYSVLPSQNQASTTLPLRLIIPKINVDANIEDLGKNSQGAMAMTKSLVNVVWYNLGPRPGENGTAVIGGHFNGGRTTSVFDNLYKLNPGDKISVTDDAGIVNTFVVREIKSYDKNADASGIFNTNDNKAHLNLITCEGIWDNASQTYSQRMVIFTNKI